MIKYKFLLKAIEANITKCPTTEKLKKLGATGQWADQEKTHTLTYADGTVITFNKNYEIIKITDNNFTANHGKRPQNFKNQEQELIKEFGEENYEKFKEYTHYKMSNIGMLFNEYLRGQTTKKDLIARCENIYPEKNTIDIFRGHGGAYTSQFLLDNHELYTKMCQHIQNTTDFATVRAVNKLHKNDSLNKMIVWDKGYTSSTLGMRVEEISEILDVDPDAWRIITKYKSGNNANHGVYLGDINKENWGSDEWMEYESAPGQKWKRTHIDVENKIIIQEPYET